MYYVPGTCMATTGTTVGEEDVAGGALVEERFKRAAERMRQNTALVLSNDCKLQLYGYFKQANEGPCNTAKPGFFDFAGKLKWEAWHKLGKMSKEEAMEKYVGVVCSVDPDWEKTPLDATQQAQSKEGSGNKGGGGGGGTGPAVSTLAGGETSDSDIPDEEKTVFDWCKECRVAKLEEMVTKESIDSKDGQGLALLHWACDRGHLDVVKFLVSRGADVNVRDNDLQTPLHYATSCDQSGVVGYLLSLPTLDRTLKDCDGFLAVEVTSDASIRQLFEAVNVKN